MSLLTTTEGERKESLRGMDFGWLFFCVSELQEWEKCSGQVEE